MIYECFSVFGLPCPYFLQLCNSCSPILHTVMAQAQIFLTYIQEEPRLYLRLVASYPDRCFSWFISVCPGRCQNNTLNWVMTTSFHVLSKSLFTVIHSFDAVQSELLMVLLSKFPPNAFFLYAHITTICYFLFCAQPCLLFPLLVELQCIFNLRYRKVRCVLNFAICNVLYWKKSEAHT